MPSRRPPLDAAPFLSWQSERQLLSGSLTFRLVDLEQIAGFGARVQVHSRADHAIAESRACAINASGQITGYYRSILQHDYVYLATEDQAVDLGRNARGLAISDDGRIVGSYTNAAGNTRAFILVDGKRLDLGTLGGANSLAFGISDAGVTGVSEDAKQRRRAFLWRRDRMIDLGVPPGGPPPHSIGRWRHSEGRGINRLGQVVGNCNHFTSGAALLTRSKRTYLGTLGGAESKAFAINNRGEITGGADIAGTDPSNGGPVHAYVLRDGEMRDLGSLGGRIAEGLAINDHGIVVGQAQGPDGQMRAFIAFDDTLRDLNAFLPAGSAFRLLVSAQGINNDGHIVGYGLDGSGRDRAFLMVPV